MKQLTFRSLVIAFVFSAGLGLTSCKNKKKDTNLNTTENNEARKDAPVVIAPDETLSRNVQDAIKDYPGVTASVNNGEVILTGTIERSKHQKMMQSIHALDPKKVNIDNLTIKE